MLKEMTQEEREVVLIKARAARLLAQEQRKDNLKWLKTGYLDMSHWLSLASEYGVRMPMTGVPASPTIIRKALKKCNVPYETWKAHYTSIPYFVKNNSKWSAQAVFGLVLELKHQYTTQKDM